MLWLASSYGKGCAGRSIVILGRFAMALKAMDGGWALGAGSDEDARGLSSCVQHMSAAMKETAGRKVQRLLQEVASGLARCHGTR